jgi:hypothetical protein
VWGIVKGTGMSKFLNSGITWTDVANLWSGLEGIHEVTVELVVTTGGKGHNGLLDYTVSAWVPTVEAHQTKTIGEVKGTWPDRDHPTFDSCIFNQLYDLDRVIGRNYEQKEITK